MKATIFANYGVLAHEYQTIYTATAPHRHTKVSEQITVEIPDSFQPHISASGEIVLHVDGMPWPYTLDELLTTTTGKIPALHWYDGQREHRQALNVIK